MHSSGLQSISCLSRNRLSRNRILAALPESELEHLSGHLEQVLLPVGRIIYEPGEQLKHAYFPTTSIASMHYVTASGPSAETASVGSEGMVGISLFLGGDTTPSSAMVQTAGYAYRLDSGLLRRAFARSRPLQDVMLRYTLTLIGQISRNAGCTRHHSLKQQLCRSLLQGFDRSNSGQFMTTQSLIAGMLGVSRDGISRAAQQLQDVGFIRFRRTHLSVLSRSGLESCVCECYASGIREFDRLLPRSAPNAGLPNTNPSSMLDQSGIW